MHSLVTHITSQTYPRKLWISVSVAKCNLPKNTQPRHSVQKHVIQSAAKDPPNQAPAYAIRRSTMFKKSRLRAHSRERVRARARARRSSSHFGQHGDNTD